MPTKQNETLCKQWDRNRIFIRLIGRLFNNLDQFHYRSQSLLLSSFK